MLACLMVMSISTASATTFDEYIHCVNTTDNTISLGGWNSTTHSGKVYIYHDVKTSVSKLYNNLFEVSNGDDYASPFATKWLTPKVNRAVESSKITQNMTVYVAARGNTYYHDDNSSITQIRITGSFGWKL